MEIVESGRDKMSSPLSTIFLLKTGARAMSLDQAVIWGDTAKANAEDPPGGRRTIGAAGH
jgi:hypothetical protein